MISNLIRGALKFSRPCTVHIVSVTKLVVEKSPLGDNANHFLSFMNRSLIFSCPVLPLLMDNVDFDTHDCRYEPSTVVKLVANAATNT